MNQDTTKVKYLCILHFVLWRRRIGLIYCTYANFKMPLLCPSGAPEMSTGIIHAGPHWTGNLLLASFTYSSSLKMVAVRSPQPLVTCHSSQSLPWDLRILLNWIPSPTCIDAPKNASVHARTRPSSHFTSWMCYHDNIPLGATARLHPWSHPMHKLSNHIYSDSKLLLGFPWSINGNPDNNLEYLCISSWFKETNQHLRFHSVVKIGLVNNEPGRMWEI
jgi:hypothetical protein